jgi:hypothetical protein
MLGNARSSFRGSRASNPRTKSRTRRRGSGLGNAPRQSTSARRTTRATAGRLPCRRQPPPHPGQSTQPSMIDGGCPSPESRTRPDQLRSTSPAGVLAAPWARSRTSSQSAR